MKANISYGTIQNNVCHLNLVHICHRDRQTTQRPEQVGPLLLQSLPRTTVIMTKSHPNAWDSWAGTADLNSWCELFALRQQQ